MSETRMVGPLQLAEDEDEEEVDAEAPVWGLGLELLQAHDEKDETSERGENGSVVELSIEEQEEEDESRRQLASSADVTDGARMQAGGALDIATEDDREVVPWSLGIFDLFPVPSALLLVSPQRAASFEPATVPLPTPTLEEAAELVELPVHPQPSALALAILPVPTPRLPARLPVDGDDPPNPSIATPDLNPPSSIMSQFDPATVTNIAPVPLLYAAEGGSEELSQGDAQELAVSAAYSIGGEDTEATTEPLDVAAAPSDTTTLPASDGLCDTHVKPTGDERALGESGPKSSEAPLEVDEGDDDVDGTRLEAESPGCEDERERILQLQQDEYHQFSVEPGEVIEVSMETGLRIEEEKVIESQPSEPVDKLAEEGAQAAARSGQKQEWKPSGRFSAPTPPPIAPRPMYQQPPPRAQPPEPPLTPRSHDTLLRASPDRFSHLSGVPPPAHLIPWRYTLELPFRGLGGRLIGMGGEVQQAIWRGSNVGEFHVWFRENRTAFATFCGSKSAIRKALELAKEALYDPGWQWSQWERQRIASMDPRWLDFNPHCCQALEGRWLLPSYAEATQPRTMGLFGASAGGNSVVQPRTAYWPPTSNGPRSASTPQDPRYAPPPQLRRSEGDRVWKPSQAYSQDFRPLLPPPRPSVEDRWTRATPVDLIPAHQALDGGRAAPRNREVSPGPACAQTPLGRRRTPTRLSTFKTVDNDASVDEEPVSSYSFSVPYSVLSRFMGPESTAHFIKLTTGVEPVVEAGTSSSKLHLRPGPGVPSTALEKARQLVHDVLRSEGVEAETTEVGASTNAVASRSRSDGFGAATSSTSPSSFRRAANSLSGGDKMRGSSDDLEQLKQDALVSRGRQTWTPKSSGAFSRTTEELERRRDSGWSEDRPEVFESTGRKVKRGRQENEDGDQYRSHGRRRDRSPSRARSRSPRRFTGRDDSPPARQRTPHYRSNYTQGTELERSRGMRRGDAHISTDRDNRYPQKREGSPPRPPRQQEAQRERRDGESRRRGGWQERGTEQWNASPPPSRGWGERGWRQTKSYGERSWRERY
ncbi:hypothetical protein Rhopal_007463-T1 [Rhodotorula paludigena]|uniref:RRM domain-containing protein n=1 Tax=Rhodotorula paludigena TaxID=86838 RepID=A0AAV5GVX1_9BASI|nr:hypothetical protein Rhopal_007463-T1 [Rhodotorula paludigena]